MGSGYVETSVGMGFAKMGHEVYFYDVRSKDLPNFTNSLDHAIENSNIFFICVPTPTTDMGIDLSAVKDAAIKIGEIIAKSDKYNVIVIKSTVIPRTTESVIISLIENYSGKKAGKFGIYVNPSFITEIEKSWTENPYMKRDFFTEDFVIIGEYETKSGDVLRTLYEPLNKPIFITDLKTAEMAKYTLNYFLATKISFWNEIFLICEKLNINSQLIANIVSLDAIVGKYGTVHGKAFGGECLSKRSERFY